MPAYDEMELWLRDRQEDEAYIARAERARREGQQSPQEPLGGPSPDTTQDAGFVGPINPAGPTQDIEDPRFKGMGRKVPRGTSRPVEVGPAARGPELRLPPELSAKAPLVEKHLSSLGMTPGEGSGAGLPATGGAGGAGGPGDPQMADAQRRANALRVIAMAGEAGATIAKAGRGGADKAYWQRTLQGAEAPVADLLAGRKEGREQQDQQLQVNADRRGDAHLRLQTGAHDINAAEHGFKVEDRDPASTNSRQEQARLLLQWPKEAASLGPKLQQMNVAQVRQLDEHLRATRAHEGQQQHFRAQEAATRAALTQKAAKEDVRQSEFYKKQKVQWSGRVPPNTGPAYHAIEDAYTVADRAGGMQNLNIGFASNMQPRTTKDEASLQFISAGQSVIQDVRHGKYGGALTEHELKEFHKSIAPLGEGAYTVKDIAVGLQRLSELISRSAQGRLAGADPEIQEDILNDIKQRRHALPVRNFDRASFTGEVEQPAQQTGEVEYITDTGEPVLGPADAPLPPGWRRK